MILPIRAQCRADREGSWCRRLSLQYNKTSTFLALKSWSSLGFFYIIELWRWFYNCVIYNCIIMVSLNSRTCFPSICFHLGLVKLKQTWTKKHCYLIDYKTALAAKKQSWWHYNLMEVPWSEWFKTRSWASTISHTAFATAFLLSLPKSTKYFSWFLRIYGKYFIAAQSRDYASISFTTYSVNICVVFYRLIKAKSHDTTPDTEYFTFINATKHITVQIQSSVTYSA